MMKDIFKLGGIILLVILGLGIFGLMTNIISFPGHVANTAVNSAKGIVDKTLDPNNVIVKYEYFHDANGQYLSRINQIKATKAFLKDETDPAEKSRLRIDLSAQQQSCRDIVTKYNANATKTNVGIFQGKEAPSSLDIQTCE